MPVRYCSYCSVGIRVDRDLHLIEAGSVRHVAPEDCSYAMRFPGKPRQRALNPQVRPRRSPLD